MKKSILALFLAAVFLFASSPANAALNAYLTLKGQKMGAIKGGVTQRNREDTIMVIAANHHAAVALDAATGMSRGAATQSIFTITKEIDRSSPLLRQAMAQNENLTTFELKFWSPQGATGVGAGTGTEVNHFTVTMKNARIVSIHFVMPNNKNPEFARYSEYEEVGFAYEQITWTWTQGGIAWSDTWTATR